VKYDSYYYFGIRPTVSGEIEEEVGLSGLPKIAESIKLKAKSQKKVVVRMLDAPVTEAILANEGAQKTLSQELLAVLEKYSFSGIVLDLEVPFTLQAEKKGQITKFVQTICSSLKQDYKTCSLLMYGDFAYRNRPYDLAELGKAADGILLMAYDFHKAGGEPGPNFPFKDKKKYGYDFKTMITDTLALVPKEKVEVVFGMYGYDWSLNEQGTPLKTAKALSLNEIQAQNSNSNSNSRMLHATSYILHSNEAREKSIQYVDSEDIKHVIWYEDEESSAVKIKYLQSVGIGKVSYWAQGYF
jgi:spore germination protein YaaH